MSWMLTLAAEQASLPPSLGRGSRTQKTSPGFTGSADSTPYIALQEILAEQSRAVCRAIDGANDLMA